MRLSEKYPEAIAYASDAHVAQVRKGTTIPYIYHPIAVSALVVEHGGSEVQAIAALLHDVLEDCGEHHAPVIAERFGPDVLAIVKALTDGMPDEHGVKADWHIRKKRYIAHLKAAAIDAVFVSACDKLHNATAIADDYAAIGEAIFDRFKQGRPGTVWYYRELERLFATRLGPDHRLVGKLGAAIGRWG